MSATSHSSLTAGIVFAIVASLTASAGLAQSRLPKRSPSERQVEEINRSLARKQQRLQSQQLNQLETNQLRQDIQRQQQFPSRIGPGNRIGPNSVRICPPGSTSC
jgi:hypothetical protein